MECGRAEKRRYLQKRPVIDKEVLDAVTNLVFFRPSQMTEKG